MKKTFWSICFFLASLVGSTYLLFISKFSGSEFVAALTLASALSFFIFYSDRIETLSIGSTVLKLKRENERAQSYIEKLSEINKALIDSLVIPMPGMADDHRESAYKNGVSFVKRYKLIKKLSEGSLEGMKPVPSDKVERAIRDYLYGTSIGIRYAAMYDDMPTIPSPATVLSNYQGKQRDGVAKNKHFQFYETELYPIYLEATKELKTSA